MNITDQTPVRVRKVVPYSKGQIEKVMGRWKTAYALCPNNDCNSYISVYMDELIKVWGEYKTRDSKKCMCGFNRVLNLGDVDLIT